MSFAIAGTVLTVGAAAYTANRSAAAGRAAARGADNATAESARQYDQTRADLASGRSLYQGANQLLGQLYGIPVQTSNEFTNQERATSPVMIGDTELPAGTTTRPVSSGARGWFEVYAPDGVTRIGTLRPGGANGRFINDTGADIQGLFAQQAEKMRADQMIRPGGSGENLGGSNLSGFFTSPDYNFRRSEGQRGVEQSFAGRGMGQSGNALRALTEFNSNLASGEFGNYFNRLATLAGLGSAATSQTAAYGAEHATNAGRNALIAGDARASGIADRANAIGGGINQLGGLWGYLSQRNQNPYALADSFFPIMRRP